jgi:hypothetical protein
LDALSSAQAGRTPENGRAVGRPAHIHKKPLEQPISRVDPEFQTSPLTTVPPISAGNLKIEENSETVRNDEPKKAVMLLGLFVEARSIQETGACIEIFYVDK